jgi:hypothetical protein
VHTADSVWAFELGHRAEEIADRLGVEKLRFAPGPLPVREPAPAVRGAPAPTPEDTRAAARLAAAITDENLRETVQKAVAAWLAGRAPTRPV